jgi:hypothetical protein
MLFVDTFDGRELDTGMVIESSPPDVGCEDDSVPEETTNGSTVLIGGGERGTGFEVAVDSSIVAALFLRRRRRQKTIIRIKPMKAKLPTTAPIIVPRFDEDDFPESGDPDSFAVKGTPKLDDDGFCVDNVPVSAPGSVVELFDEPAEPKLVEEVVALDEDKGDEEEVGAVPSRGVVVVEDVDVDVGRALRVGGWARVVLVVVVGWIKTSRTIRSTVNCEFPAGVPRESASFFISTVWIAG